ncbi:MAG: InlB B-repeat-containing protein [Candidatus Bathyarchaeota archaeon]|nr:InlB B-repeat-containing protein [Candidatus Bathyarchaeota archaeon]
MKNKRVWLLPTLVIAFSIMLIIQPTMYLSKGDSGSSTQCFLNARVNLSGAGSLSVSSGYYNYGTILTIFAYTNTGFVFDGWYLDGVYQGKLSSFVLEMKQDHDLVGVFSKRPVSLTITINPPEAATTVPAPGISTYDFGDSVLVTEYPNGGYTFDGWYLDGLFIGAGTSARISMDKDHQLSAYFESNSSATPAPTPLPTPTPTVTPSPTPTPTSEPTPVSTSSPTPVPVRPLPELIFTCRSSTAYSGFNVQIDGGLSVNSIGLSGAGILLSYSVTGGRTWNDLAYVITSDNGTFSAIWMPSATGNYLINATWTGDAAYSNVSEVVNFAVTPFVEMQSVFSVTSNSTISSFSFDSSTDALSFSVSGPSGTSGYVVVSIPKSLIINIANLQVLLDGQALNYATDSQRDAWEVFFMYAHSTHNVVVNLNSDLDTATPVSSPSQLPSPTPATPQPTELPPTSQLPTTQPTVKPEGNLLENWEVYVIIAVMAITIVLLIVMLSLKKRRIN